MKRTVIVIGAGASADFGGIIEGRKSAMPTGEELVKKIADRARLKEMFVEQIGHIRFLTEADRANMAEREFKPYLDLSELVAYYEPFSIDEFLNSIKQDMVTIKIRDHLTTPKDELIAAGKTLIAMFLLQAEDEKVFEGFSSTCWYRHLRSAIITNNNDEGEIKKNLKGNLTIISFNYDRSLDYFLQTRLDKFYNSITVIYPYGKLAGEWEGGDKKNYSLLPYGYFKNYTGHDGVERDVVRNKIFLAAQEAAKKLRIIGEFEESDESKKMREKVAEATNIYFLGFGFHQENCRILGMTPEKKLPPQIEMRNEKGGISTESRITFYTNFKDSKKIKQKFRQFTNCNPEIFSDKSVYAALRSDFNLEL